MLTDFGRWAHAADLRVSVGPIDHERVDWDDNGNWIRPSPGWSRYWLGHSQLFAAAICIMGIRLASDTSFLWGQVVE
jgi:hypothetical protein